VNKVLHIMGIILIIASVFLLSAVPPVGILGIVFGAFCIIKSFPIPERTVLKSQVILDPSTSKANRINESRRVMQELIDSGLIKSDRKLYEEEIENEKFQEWLDLREQYREAKREKDYQKIIDISNSILKLDVEAKFIEIFVPLFEKDIADAYLKMGQEELALVHYRSALLGFRLEHEKDKKRNPESWVKDIERLERKIAALS